MASADHFVERPFLAADEIGDLLCRGSLSLFLGAGVSSGFGLPEWALLVARLLCAHPDSEFVNTLRAESDRQVSRRVDPLDTKDHAFALKVHSALYRDSNESITSHLMHSPLLLAVAALMCGSARGRIARVFTYNYDDILECYLRRLGLAVSTRYRPTETARHADVEVNHVHGFLPRPDSSVPHDQRIILSESSYREMRAWIDAGWSHTILAELQSHVGLFVGLSGDDSSIIDVLERARVNRSESYSGYWLMTPRAFDDNQKTILDVGMCPIRLEVDQFPEFLFAVCERAGAGILR